MNANKGNREEDIFREALKRPEGAERGAFLDQACGNNHGLRLRLDSLLRAHVAPVTALGGITEALPEGAFRVGNVDEETPGTRIGRYKLLQKIGEGGMGMVYMAEQEEPLRRRVALKIIKLGMDTKQVVARFEAERQALALMDHPNIAKVLDATITESGRPYFVMELVRGIKITQYCDQNKLSTRERLNLFIQVCHAIQHAHQKGIIHRDIKPSNILVSLHDGVPVPIVIDFGIAKATEQRLTEKTLFTAFAQFVGTPAYTSPEQAEMSRLDIDTRSDVYSLGVLLYELLTGTTPFESEKLLSAGLDEMRRTIRELEPPRPSTRLSTMLAGELTATAERRRAEPPKLVSLVRGDLDWIVMKCLEKDRTRRYETASSLGQDIVRHLENEPILARPPGSFYRIQKTVLRHRVAFAATGVVSLVLVVGLFLTSWQAIRATRAEREQLKLRRAAEHATAEEAAARQSAQVARDLAEQAKLEAQRISESRRQETYAAEMRAAQIALDSGSLGNCRHLLLKYKPNPAEAPAQDLRGIEWRYLWQESRSQAIADFKADREVTSAGLSPDGRFIAAGIAQGGLVIWDRTAMVQYKVPPAASQACSRTVVFFPDGAALAYCATNGVVILSTNQWRVLDTFPGNFSALALSTKGDILAAAGPDSAMLWHLDKSSAKSCMLSLVQHQLEQTTFNAPMLEFSTDGKRVFISDLGAGLFAWDTTTGKPDGRFPQSESIVSLAVSPEGPWLAGAGWDGVLSIWSLENFRLLLTQQVAPSSAEGLAFSHTGNKLVTGGSDGRIKIWEVHSNPGDNLTLSSLGQWQGHDQNVNGLWFAAGAMISVGHDHVFIWPETPPLSRSGSLKQLTDFKDGFSKALGLSSDGNRLWLFLSDTNLGAWDYHDTNRVVTTVQLPEKPKEIGWYRGELFYRSANNWMCRFNPEANSLVRLFPCSGTNFSPYALVDYEGHPVLLSHATSSRYGTGPVSAWDLKANAPAHGPWIDNLALARVAQTEGDPNRCILNSPDNKWIVQAEEGGTISLWDVQRQGRVRQFPGHGKTLNWFAFSPDSQVLATGAWDPTLRLWDIKTGFPMGPPMRSGPSSIWFCAFSKDGRTLLSGGLEMTIRMWNVAAGQEMVVIEGCDLISSGEANQFINDGLLFWKGTSHQGTYAYLPLPTLAEIDAEIAAGGERKH